VAELSRRRMLQGGGVLGAVGALGLVAPSPAWTWSPKGSVVGSGSGTDPRYTWDDDCDAMVALMLERGEVDLVNSRLAGWTRNDQALPSGLPDHVRTFLERERELPTWADKAKLNRAFSFYEKRGLYLGALYGFGSGMMSCVIPREAKAVYYSAGGADMKDRIAKTAKLGYDIGAKDAFGPSGQMVVTCLKTRMVHSAVRYLLPKSGHWKASAEEAKPISQADTMVTWHSLATFSTNKLDAWGVPVSNADSDAFLHLWQVAARMLGVQDQYIPADWSQANTQSRQVLDPILAPSTEGKKLAKMLLNLASEYDRGLTKPLMHSATRYNLGDQIANWLEVPREPMMDPMMKAGWPAFIAFREATLKFPFPPQGYWMFDEFLRLAVMFFLGDGKQINITIPTGNNPNYG
jgi:endo-cleaving rubber dioxygenase